MYGWHLVQIDQTNPKQGVGRIGQTDERKGLSVIAIEFCQSQGRKNSHDKSRKWQKSSQNSVKGIGLDDIKAEHGRSDAKGDNIGQRVELLADRTADVQGAGRHAVEEVEHSAANDEPASQANHFTRLQTTINSEATAQEVATGNQVGYIDKRRTFHNEVE